MSLTATYPELAPDLVLPQRDLLLDEGEVARRLSGRLGAGRPLDIDSCERVRTKYRVGDSLRVLHRIVVAGRAYSVAARAYPAGRSGRAYERALATAGDRGRLRPVALDEEIETVFWTFPNDRKIAGLSVLKHLPRALAQLVPAWTSSRVVAYAPEKCATAECLDDASRVLAYAKIYSSDDGRKVFGVYDAFRRNAPTHTGGLSLPRAIAYAGTYRVLLLERVEGRRIADLHGPDLVRGYRRLGAALAALHNLPVPRGLPSFRRLDVGRITHASSIIGQVRTDVRGEAAALADELARRWRETSGPAVCLHGDVHPKNGILHDDRLTLIDLDQTGVGHPAADLGSLLGGLTYSRLVGLLSERAARELGDVFLEGYAGERELPEADSLRWHTAAALLAERALRAVNRVRPAGLVRLRQLLLEARGILRKGGGE